MQDNEEDKKLPAADSPAQPQALFPSARPPSETSFSTLVNYEATTDEDDDEPIGDWLTPVPETEVLDPDQIMTTSPTATRRDKRDRSPLGSKTAPRRSGRIQAKSLPGAPRKDDGVRDETDSETDDMSALG